MRRVAIGDRIVYLLRFANGAERTEEATFIGLTPSDKTRPVGISLGWEEDGTSNGYALESVVWLRHKNEPAPRESTEYGPERMRTKYELPHGEPVAFNGATLDGHALAGTGTYAGLFAREAEAPLIRIDQPSTGGDYVLLTHNSHLYRS